MKRIILLLLALTCFTAVWANQYSLSLPYPYVEAITSPSSGSYTDISAGGQSVVVNYRYPQTTYTADELRTRLNNLINSQGLSSWLSVSSLTLNTSARTGSITFFIAANKTSYTRSLQISAGSTSVTYLQAILSITLSPSEVHVIPGETINITLSGSVSGTRYELCRNGVVVDSKTGTGSALSFTQVAADSDRASDLYTVSAPTAVNGSCVVYYNDLIAHKLIRQPYQTIPIDQQGGSVIIRCTWEGEGLLSEVTNIVNKMNDGRSAYWDKNRVTISYRSYSTNYCELSFNFTPNTGYSSIYYNSLFMFNDGDMPVEFVQEGVNQSSVYTNWMRTRIFTFPNASQWISDIVYYDGLGRAEQTVRKNASPLGLDLVTIVDFDSFGRESKQWQPVAIAGNGAQHEVSTIRSKAQSFYADSAPYTEAVYESSPLNRTKESWNAGQVMRDNNAKMSVQYAPSGAGEVLIARVDASGILQIAPASTTSGGFSKRVSTDADGLVTQTFTDLQENLVLTRTIAGSVVCDTYYFYDLQDRLRWVVSPEGSRQLQAGGNYSENDDFVKKYCYTYRYDTRGRITSKKLPGKALESFVYNDGDQIIGHQDGNAESQGIWTISEYDRHQRLLWEGVISGKSRSTLESVYNSNRSLESLRSESSFRLMRQCWYGQKPLSSDSELYFSRPDTDWVEADSRTRDMKVYEQIAVLGGPSGNYIERAFYYDTNGRLIQLGELNTQGNVSRYSTKYDFTGNVLEQRDWHEGAPSSELRQNFVYDRQGRRLSATIDLNGQKAYVSYLYDALGRPSVTSYGSGVNRILDSVSYNVQGWVTSNENRLFRTNLRYYDPSKSATARSFTGNITEWTWQHIENGSPSQENTYAFTYDGLSRLTGTNQYIDGVANDRNVEKGITYDLNGNIKALQRYAGGSLYDNLSYSYSGNQLASISGTTSGSYAYDSNGNMTADGPNNLSLTYNRLNLTEKVTQNGTTVANYSYLSDGSKVAATDAAGNGLVYLGSLVYKKQNGALTLESAGFEGGRFVASSTSSGTIYQPHYFITDHLGSVRVVVDGNGTVQERNDYYPYGMRWNEGLISATNRYRYNGKEWQGFLNVPYNDHGARMVDSRFRLSWGGVDPLANKFPEHGTYVFCAGNPIKYADFDGRDWRDVVNGVAVALIDNMSRVNLRGESGYKDANHYNIGQDIGDIISVFSGVGTIGGGATMTGGGVSLAFATGGTSSVVSAGAVVTGVGMMTLGAQMTVSAFSNLTDQKGRVPNPNGSKGKPDHQAKVKELKDKARSEAGPKEEVRIEKKIESGNSKRRPDVQIVDTKSNKTRKVYEAERHPGSKRNQLREQEYRDLGIEQETHRVQ